MAWDRGALSATCDDASKLLQLLADKLRALQMSAFDEELSLTARDEKKPTVFPSTTDTDKTRLEQHAL
jgi:hypothetical protein